MLRYGAEVGEVGVRAVLRPKAMVNVVEDQRALGFGDGALDGVQLGGHVAARPAVLDHANHTAHLTLGATQAGEDGGVAGVKVRRSQAGNIPPGGICSRPHGPIIGLNAFGKH